MTQYGTSPAMTALDLVKRNNAQIREDTPERRAELADAMKAIAEEEALSITEDAE